MTNSANDPTTLAGDALTGYRLSTQQNLLWQQLAQHPALRSQVVVLIDGDLKSLALRSAVQHVVQQHEILRTTFRRLPEMTVPVQVIDDRWTPTWENLELEEQPDAAAIDAILDRDYRRPYDLGQGPPWRIALTALSPRRHLMLISLSSLLADTTTLRNFTRQIARAYGRDDSSADDPDSPIQYVQFSEWQHDLLREEDSETAAARAYWQEQISAASAVPGESPPEVESPAAESFCPQHLDVPIDGNLLHHVELVSEQSNISYQSLLLATWQALLARLSGHNDVVVWEACEGRPHESLRCALGPFVKWLPRHFRMRPDEPFDEVLTRVGSARRRGEEWEDYFAGHTADSTTGGFAIEFQGPPVSAQAHGVTFSVCRLSSWTRPFALKLASVSERDGVTLRWHYDPRRYHAEDVLRMARHHVTLIKSVIRAPSTHVSRLELLDETDRQQLLVRFNDTAADYRSDVCIHELFRQPLSNSPDRVAVAFGDEHLTYARLNARADRLARRLRFHGVGPDVRVGLCTERGCEMVVALLGILQAGGAFVPLDPTHPKKRLRLMLEEFQPKVVLSEPKLREALPEFAGPVLSLDGATSAAERGADSYTAVPRVTSRNLAYVMYTSGSTGRPKGVMIEHRSVVNLEHALRQAVYTDRDCPMRVGLNAPLTFDAAIKQLLPLLRGHAVRILPEDVRPDGKELISFVNRFQLDVLDATPIQLRLMLQQGFLEKRSCGPVTMLVGGEALDGRTWTALAASPDTTFFNVYGPTECTVDATSCAAGNDRKPTIGRPLANTQLYILDRHGCPACIGSPGELFLGGAGLARGYVNAPAATAERFVPDPFGQLPGARLYRTGDTGAYRANGAVDFLGRRDHQVKIRGFRIELGEIESMLGRHPAVRETVVHVPAEEADEPRLVAYVVWQRPHATNVSELRNYLREHLPEYMIPSVFVTLKALPISRHGKVDRQALPAVGLQPRQLEQQFVAPRTELERAVAGVWQQVLGVEKVGTDDNFFDLGGHSLLLVQAHGKLRELFHSEISLIDMFRNPTVRSLAEHFHGQTRAQQPSESSAVEKALDRAQKRKRARVRHAPVNRTVS